MSDVRAKTLSLTAGRLADDDVQALLAAAVELERLPSVAPLARILTRCRPEAGQGQPAGPEGRHERSGEGSYEGSDEE